MRIVQRVNLIGQEARDANKAGIDKVYDMLSLTLGPKGKNVLIEQQKGPPIITNDGFYIAREIILEDESENLAAQSLINVATIQNSVVGDGTTGATVLAWDIIHQVYEEIKSAVGGDERAVKMDSGNNNHDLMEIKRDILTEAKVVVSELAKMSKPVKTKEEIKQVAFTSIEDEEAAEVIADMAFKMGQNGSISVEEGYGSKVKTEMISGYKFLGKYIDDKLSTNERKEAILDEPLIFITNEYIENPFDVARLGGWLKSQGKGKAVLIAEGFSKDVLPTIIAAALTGDFYFLAIKAGSLTTEEYEDLAIYTGGHFFDKERGMALSQIIDKSVKPTKINIAMEQFGRARRVVVDKNKTLIIDGKGGKKVIDGRIAELKVQKDEVEKTDMFKKKLEKRIASMSGGVGLIEVASNSDLTTEYLIGKYEDAVFSCKAAMEFGVVKGGGLALKEISEKMPEGRLAKSLVSLYNLIQNNAGGSLEIPDTIVDPLKVVQCIVENATDFAASFITCEGSMAWKKTELEDRMAKVITDAFGELSHR